MRAKKRTFSLPLALLIRGIASSGGGGGSGRDRDILRLVVLPPLLAGDVDGGLDPFLRPALVPEVLAFVLRVKNCYIDELDCCESAE